MSNVAAPLARDDRKRLGQYFTGEPLARVLAALARVGRDTSVIDPMAGSGDMLAAARAVGDTFNLTAVEIDPRAGNSCRERFVFTGASVDVRVADAFDPDTWACDGQRTWDLVITNPPYVRYQRSSRTAVGRVRAPSATEIRRGLLHIVDARGTLSTEDRRVFRALIEGYSGLADLAVPSWLLCALLVAPQGRLAMLVPDTWLSRDYALPILYLLRRYFDIEHVVEDGEASWFEDALVRTTLVVARRSPGRSSALALDTRHHVHSHLTSTAADSRSLVGALHPRASIPEYRFVDRLRTVATSGTSIHAPGLTAKPADDTQMREKLASQLARTQWGLAVEEPSELLASRSSADLPRYLREIVGDLDGLSTLEEMGWCVGQGLRTGANRFFYGEFVEGDEGESLIAVDRELSPRPITVPNDVLRIAVRKQRDLAPAVNDQRTSLGRLIYLVDYALEEDLAAAQALGVSAPYIRMSQDLEEHVRRAARLNVGTPTEPRLLPQLSAVVTNVRAVDEARSGRPARFWYQLPPLAPRHTGDLFLARVCYGHPSVHGNGSQAVIDANFSTLWPDRPDPVLAPSAMLAFLNSTWMIASMESSGTVLGGGALKIEATQNRRLPLPRVTAEAATHLECLGELVGKKGEVSALRADVDDVVWALLGLGRGKAEKVRTLCSQLLRSRTPPQRASLRSSRRDGCSDC